MRYFVVLLTGAVLWVQGSGANRVEASETDSISLKQRDSLEAIRPQVGEQPIIFPEIGNRMTYLGVTVLTVGGLAILLNRRRRRLDKELEGATHDHEE